MLTSEQKEKVTDIFYNSMAWGAGSYLVCIGVSIAVNTILESNIKSVGMFASLVVGGLVTAGMFKRQINKLVDDNSSAELTFRP